MPSRLIEGRRIVEDTWLHLEDEAPLPPSGDLIVSLARFLRERDALLAHAGRLGVRIGPAARLEALLPDLDRLALVALEFPTFGDGRAYSHARLLRGRHGFRGQLRAVGDVLRDQLLFMERCGIDAFELRADRDPEDALRAFEEFDAHYQAVAPGERAVWELRRGEAPEVSLSTAPRSPTGH